MVEQGFNPRIWKAKADSVSSRPAWSIQSPRPTTTTQWDPVPKRSWRDGSSVNSACSPSKRPEFSSKHLFQLAHNRLYRQLQRIQCPILASLGTAHMTHINNNKSLKVNRGWRNGSAVGNIGCSSRRPVLTWQLINVCNCNSRGSNTSTDTQRQIYKCTLKKIF